MCVTVCVIKVPLFAHVELTGSSATAPVRFDQKKKIKEETGPFGPTYHSTKMFFYENTWEGLPFKQQNIKRINCVYPINQKIQFPKSNQKKKNAMADFFPKMLHPTCSLKALNLDSQQTENIVLMLFEEHSEKAFKSGCTTTNEDGQRHCKRLQKKKIRDFPYMLRWMGSLRLKRDVRY